MKLTTKLMAFGAVAALIVSGIAVVLMTSTNASAAGDTPIVTVDGQNSNAAAYNLTVQVMGKIDGQRVPLAGVNVTVCTMNITTEGNRTVVTVDNVAVAQTDADGKAIFNLTEGKYFVFAQYHGLKGFAHVNLTEDEVTMVYMHHWNWGHMKGQKFQVPVTDMPMNGHGYGDKMCMGHGIEENETEEANETAD